MLKASLISKFRLCSTQIGTWRSVAILGETDFQSLPCFESAFFHCTAGIDAIVVDLLRSMGTHDAAIVTDTVVGDTRFKCVVGHCCTLIFRTALVDAVVVGHLSQMSAAQPTVIYVAAALFV